jgi:hypothetical protein
VIVNRLSGSLLEFRHDGVASARPAIWIIAGIVGAGALWSLFDGSVWPALIVFALGAFFFHLMRRSSAETLAMFDRQKGTVTVTHSRDGVEIERTELPLHELSRVIVEAPGNGKGRLTLRPALAFGTRIVPLTWRIYIPGDAPVEAALAIRRFLGHSDFKLFEDSVEALARHSDRIAPAVQVARLGLGMNRFKAAAHVRRLRSSA